MQALVVFFGETRAGIVSLHALEAAARVERAALRARVQLSAAPRAAAVDADFFFDDGAALRAPDDLAEPGHVDVAWAVLRNAPRAGGRAGFGRRTRRLRLRLPIAIVVVVAALTVFAVAHVRTYLRSCIKVLVRQSRILVDGRAGC